MTKTKRHILFATFALISCVQASSEGAARVLAEYERNLQDWTAKITAADGVEARRALWKLAPDSEEFGKKLLKEIDANWNKEWILDYTAKLLEFAPAYAKTPSANYPDKTPAGVIRDTSEKFHFTSNKIGPVAIALATVDNGPKTRQFLEKLESTHADKVVQGQAALALAMLYSEAGEDIGVKARRLTLLRKAIINANDAKAMGGKVGDFAEAMLYQITKLEKGMLAPDLLGPTVSDEVLRLSDFRGRPVALIFWHTRMEAYEETINYLRGIQDRFVPQGAVVLGVASESRMALRAMVKDQTVTWKNLVDEKGELANSYQVSRYPMAWVIDAEGRVQYRGVPGAFLDLTIEGLLKK